MSERAGQSSEDDIDAWVDRLRGRSLSDCQDKESDTMRSLLHERAAAEVPPLDQHAYQRLRFRLRREGLLSASNSFLSPKVLALAAGIFGVALTLRLFVPSLQTPEVLDVESVETRGDGVVPTINASEPQVVASTLGRRFSAIEVPYRLAELPDGSWLLEAKVPMNKLKIVSAMLTEYHVAPTAIPANGQLRLVVKRNVATP